MGESGRLTFSVYPMGKRYDTMGSANGFYSPATPETPLNFGGAISNFGKKNALMLDTRNYFTKEEACVTGWRTFRSNYLNQYSWISSSFAEYQITAISTFGGVGQCYIYDGPDRNLKMKLDIYELFQGNPPGYSDAEGSFLRFLREDGSVIVFSTYPGYINQSKTGETLEVSFERAE